MISAHKKIFAALFLSIFCSVTGVGIVVPLLPVYASKIGSTGIYIGLVFGAFSLSRTAFLPYFGRQSDIRGRKPFIVIGLFAYALVSVAFILSTSVESLIGIRFVQGIASAMIMPVAQAYLGDITVEGSEGLTMGLFNMAMFLGLSLGPVAGGVIYEKISLDAAFIGMGILSTAAFLSSLLLLPSVHSEKAAFRHVIRPTLKMLITNKLLMSLFMLRFAHTACIGIIWAFLPVYASQSFNMGSSAIGTLVMLGILVSGVLQAPMGWLADRFSKQALSAIGGLIVGITIFLFQWADGFWDMFWISVGFGFGGGMLTPSIMALAIIWGNRLEGMGAVMSLMTMAHSLGMLVGSVGAGWMMDVIDLKYAFGSGGVLMLVCSLVFLLPGYKNAMSRPVPDHVPGHPID
jgi:MFS family permease